MIFLFYVITIIALVILAVVATYCGAFLFIEHLFPPDESYFANVDLTEVIFDAFTNNYNVYTTAFDALSYGLIPLLPLSLLLAVFMGQFVRKGVIELRVANQTKQAKQETALAKQNEESMRLQLESAEKQKADALANEQVAVKLKEEAETRTRNAVIQAQQVKKDYEILQEEVSRLNSVIATKVAMSARLTHQKRRAEEVINLVKGLNLINDEQWKDIERVASIREKGSWNPSIENSRKNSAKKKQRTFNVRSVYDFSKKQKMTDSEG